MAERRIFHTGTLEEIDGKLVQVGIHCKSCGKVSFPQSELCMFCGSDDYEKAPLSTTGTLYSYSITRRPVGPYIPPIIGGYIDLPEGARVYGQIRADESQIKRGMKLNAQVGVLWTEADGTEVMGYYYEPERGENGGQDK